ncbi:MAG: hypothetical protein F4Z85_12675 [Gemmatimonadetes bacterium]|nr:hypothetical protein [Gemmatimonadota bacterium]MYB71005.1 hypothetical protein [Gemmatimonadota bacterium]
MKSLAIRNLYFTLIAAWFAIASIAVAEPKPQYGGFASDDVGLQAHLDHINSLEMIPVEAGAALQQAVAAIPVETDISITPEQETDLRGWLYELLVAFSASSSDSLAIAFYMRGGVDHDLMKQIAAHINSQRPGFLKGDTPKDLLQAMHRETLDSNGRDYYFEKVSFLHSAFTVFAMQDEYASYQDYAETHGMIPGVVYSGGLPLQQAVAQQLQAGEQRVFAQFMFIDEEPEASADFEQGPRRTPCFFRLIWDPEWAVWRPVEAFFNSQVRHEFLFFTM